MEVIQAGCRALYKFLQLGSYCICFMVGKTQDSEAVGLAQVSLVVVGSMLVLSGLSALPSYYLVF